MSFRVLSTILVFSMICQAEARPSISCAKVARETLNSMVPGSPVNEFTKEYEYLRQSAIHRDINFAGATLSEKKRLVKTFEMLDLYRGRKELESSLEREFKETYYRMALRLENPAPLHEFVQAVIKGDEVTARNAAEKVKKYMPKVEELMQTASRKLSRAETVPAELVLEDTVHPVLWLKPDPNSKLGGLAQILKDRYGARVIVVEDAHRLPHQKGFFGKDLVLNGEKGPVLAISEDDLNFDQLSYIVHHEYWHGEHFERRLLEKGGAYDFGIYSTGESTPMKVAGYEKGFSFEEVGNAAMDARHAQRADTDVIVKALQAKKGLPLAQVFDLEFLKERTEKLSYFIAEIDSLEPQIVSRFDTLSKNPDLNLFRQAVKDPDALRYTLKLNQHEFKAAISTKSDRELYEKLMRLDHQFEAMKKSGASFPPELVEGVQVELNETYKKLIGSAKANFLKHQRVSQVLKQQIDSIHNALAARQRSRIDLSQFKALQRLIQAPTKTAHPVFSKIK